MRVEEDPCYLSLHTYEMYPEQLKQSNAMHVLVCVSIVGGMSMWLCHVPHHR